MDQRDTAINQLSQLMDVRVVTDRQQPDHRLHQFGVELVGTQASTLTFNSPGTLNANSL